MKTRSAKRHAQSAGDCHGWHAWPRRRRWIRSGAALLFFPGCGGGETPAKDTETKAPETVATESTLAAMPAPGGTCPAYGLWQACSVEDRISRAGLAVNRREEGVRHDFMSVEGLVWETSRAEIQVFLYASEADRKKDTDRLDTVLVAPPGQRVMWKWPATLVTSGNLAAIILSLNGRQAERIALALGAGLPVR
jgi:hypothetical protein